MEDNDPALVAKVANVLLSQECQRINFRWGRLHVDAKAYRAVVFAMVDSRINLREARGKYKLDSDVEAEYRGATETLIIRPNLHLSRIFNRMTIVHESTHAIQDAELADERVWSLDTEATAYIAEWLLDVYSSPDPRHLKLYPDPDEPIDIIALEIARSLAGTPGASPDPAAMRRLGDAIFKNPTYSVSMELHPWARNDGVTEPEFP